MLAAPAFVRVTLVGSDGKAWSERCQLRATALRCFWVDAAIRTKHDAVPITSPLARHVAREDVLAHALGVAGERVAEASASRGLHDDDVLAREGMTRDLPRRGELSLDPVVGHDDLHRRARSHPARAERRDGSPIPPHRVTPLPPEESKLPAQPEPAPPPPLP